MILILCAFGFAFAIATAFSCKQGPFEVFLKLRNTFGKPFTCSYCMSIYSGFLSFVLAFLPEFIQVALGVPGWVMLVLHVSQIHVLYEPNPGE